MTSIVPCLWFDNTAEEAVACYTAAFAGGVVNSRTFYPTEGLADFQKDRAGQVLTVEFEIAGQKLTALNAGDDFAFTESLSFMVTVNSSVDPDARNRLDTLWNTLIDGGRALMPLAEYDFSAHYGWLCDRFGVHWQLMLTDAIDEPTMMVTPALMFGGPVQNQARQATEFYADVFSPARLGTDVRYTEQSGPAAPGSVMFSNFQLRDQWFVAMDAGAAQQVTFTEAFSFVVPCDDQKEIDYFWAALSAHPDSEQCGWCKDQFGISWQITPANMDELMARPSAFEHLLGMKKIVIDQF